MELVKMTNGVEVIEVPPFFAIKLENQGWTKVN